MQAQSHEILAEANMLLLFLEFQILFILKGGLVRVEHLIQLMADKSAFNRKHPDKMV